MIVLDTRTGCVQLQYNHGQYDCLGHKDGLCSTSNTVMISMIVLDTGRAVFNFNTIMVSMIYFSGLLVTGFVSRPNTIMISMIVLDTGRAKFNFNTIMISMIVLDTRTGCVQLQYNHDQYHCLGHRTG
ncbi:hypothetical protein RRG08_064365 [Elysia crispata]|uniref:Uncharacterized protein n=1 Tax=Elysia crispata TaxID=231223 RepID=A0AAE0ZSQ2_9GAST|nr:hypothetical protein RRG08_064365 [Elysia crispata]